VGFIRDATGSFRGGMLFLAALLMLAGIGTLMLRKAALLRED
jgi:MFS-type transporter involved in bile tolerance (Atg22 family)